MTARRKIIRIDESKCNGCGACIPNCPEGALQILDGKARLVSDLFCDGLGACLGHCPLGAITVEEREAEPYDEARVLENIVRQGPETLAAHLEHLRSHGEHAFYQEAVNFLEARGIPLPAAPRPQPAAHGGCPGSRVRQLQPAAVAKATEARRSSRLGNWPVQLALVPPRAPYFDNAKIVLAADCVGFAAPNFHGELLQDEVLLIACPKLDDGDAYVEKLAAIFRNNRLRSVTILHMEVPCCFGLVEIVREAVRMSGKEIPVGEITIGINGERLEQAGV